MRYNIVVVEKNIILRRIIMRIMNKNLDWRKELYEH